MNERLTGFSAKELEDFFLLLPRIFCDYRDPGRGPLKMLYLYGETTDNDRSVHLTAIEMANVGAMKSIGIAEGELGHGYAGFDVTVERLKSCGWSNEMPIVKCDTNGNVNTPSEARALVRYAQVVGGDIGIVAPAFHLLRAFMTTVTAIGDGDLRVYAIPGAPLRWSEQVVHSQGVLRNTRVGLLGDELKRLEKYRTPEYGGMLSAAQVLRYLKWRDA